MNDLRERVAAHLCTAVTDDGMTCPQCGGDYGPTMSLDDLATFEDGYLPPAPLLAGVCLDCGYIYEPPGQPDELGDTPRSERNPT